MKNLIITILNLINPKSAWCKAVIADALSILDCFTNDEIEKAINSGALEILLLNGARDWKEYSYGGLALIFDSDIAKHYCTPSELKKTDCGRRNPNKRETWLDVQARALWQAAQLIKQAARNL